MRILLDLILGFCTGGLWFIYLLIRNLNSSYKRNKAARRFYRKH